MADADIARTLRDDIKRLRAERDGLSAEAASLQRQVDVLLADVAEGGRRVDQLRAFEREYRSRLVGWLEGGLDAIKGAAGPDA